MKQVALQAADIPIDHQFVVGIDATHLASPVATGGRFDPGTNRHA